MAARYWVGGAGNWSSTTKWSTSSGGASGATVPTSADDVIFDANSGGKFTATVDVAANCNSISFTPSAGAGVLQLAMNNSLTVVGNFTTSGTAGNNRIWIRGATYSLGWNFSVGGTVTISDVDFRDVYVVGASAPITGTRLGNHGNVRNVTFPAAKTVYWNLAAGGNISATAWALTSGGAVSTDNHPLAQDTAVIVNTGLNTSATVTLDAAVPYLGALDMSGRTTAMTISSGAAYAFYGSFLNGVNTTISGTGGITFANRTGTATFSPNGKTVTFSVTVDTWGAGELALGSNALFDLANSGVTFNVNSGVFTTNNYNVTVPRFISYNSNPRTINAGSSTITGSFDFYAIYMTSTNMTFNAGTSTFVFNAGSSNNTFISDNLFYNLILKGSGVFQHVFNCQNLTLAPALTTGIYTFSFYTSVNVFGTFTITANPTQRVHVQSNSNGTQRTFYVGALSVPNSGFKDIAFTGPGSGVTLTSSCNYGNNTGISFAAPVTYYWNLAGSQNWSANGWATSSGGTPSAANFPLSQDTAVFDNAGAAGTVTLDADWYLPNLDMSARTNAMTFVMDNRNPSSWGDFKMGTGVTPSSTGTTMTIANASPSGTNNFLSNGKTFNFALNFGITTNGNMKLLDAFSTTGVMTFQTGTFDANGMTAGFDSVAAAGSNTRYLSIAGATINLSGAATLFDVSVTGGLYIYADANTTWVSTDNSTSTKYWNQIVGNMMGRLVIGGNTSSSTFSFSATSVFSEITTTKTVPFTLNFGATVVTNKWTLTGAAGRVVTCTGTGTLRLIGTTTSGIDYLALGTVNFDTTNSTGIFYAGANSTGGVGFTLTAAPSPRTMYWVGGTGNWSDTTHWATSSGGAGGNPVPTPFDTVTFNSASSAGTYTVTIDQTFIYSSTFTANAPATGTLTLTGNSNHCLYGSATFAAANVTNGAGNNIYICGDTGNITYTPNGTSTVYNWYVHGRLVNFILGGAINTGGTFSTGSGTLDTAGYSLTVANSFSCNSWYAGVASAGNLRNSSINVSETSGMNPIMVQLQSIKTTPTVTASSVNVTLQSTYGARADFAYCPINNFTVNGGSYSGISVYNLTQIIGTLSWAPNGRYLYLYSNFSVGTLNITDGGGRWTFNPNGWNVPYSVSVGAVTSLKVTDFNDTTITGAAAPITTGTLIGDLGGNSGITFPAPKTVYWNRAAGGNWWSASWATTPGGAVNINNYPLAQDTGVIQDANLNSGASITINNGFNAYVPYLSNVDITARTLPMTFNWAGQNVSVYGSFRSSSSVTQAAAGTIYFYGRAAKTLKSAGASWNASFYIDNLTGSLTLEDALNTSTTTGVLTIYRGTFSAGNQNVSIGSVVSNSNLTRTITMGSGTWTLKNSGTVWNVTSTNTTFNGGGTITMNNAAAKTFSVSSMMNLGSTVIDQSGAGALTLNASFTCGNITASYISTGATSILLGGNFIKLPTFTATGTVTNALTITGANGGFILTGGGTVTTSTYMILSAVKGFPTTNTWYAGSSSTNSGTLGFFFINPPYSASVSETASGSDVISAITSVIYASSILELATGTDTFTGSMVFPATLTEVATVTDSNLATLTLGAATAETATGTDSVSTLASFGSSLAELATITDAPSATSTIPTALAETATITDANASVSAIPSSLVETATVTDANSAKATIPTSLVEVSTVTDANLATLTISSSLADLATVTDSPSAASVIPTALAEVATVTDANLATLTISSSLTDLATGTESVAAAATFISTATETATGADSIATTATISPTLSELATGTDAIATSAAFVGVVAELATITDSPVANIIALAAVAELVTATDAPSAAATFVSLLTELATMTDAAAVAASTFNASTTDTAAGTDTVLVAPSTFGASIAELSSGADVVTVNLLLPASVAETASGVDVVSALQVFKAMIAELVTGADSVSTILTATATVAETAAAADTISALSSFIASVLETGTASDIYVAANVVSVALAELATSSDSMAAKATFAAAVADQAALTDVAIAVATLRTSISELAQGADAVSAAQVLLAALIETATGTSTPVVAPSVFNAPVVEIATLSDTTLVAPSIFNAPVLEQGQASDILTTTAILNATFSSVAVLSDVLQGSNLWNIIDDSQAVTWGLVNDAQPNGWNLVDDNQTPGWQNINTL